MTDTDKRKVAYVLAILLAAPFLVLGLRTYWQQAVYPAERQAVTRQPDNPFQYKKIAFIGDSITYGYDSKNHGKQMKNPWVKQVGEKLGVRECQNYGVSSASVMDIRGTKMAVVKAYQKMDEDIDILGVMIGINDAYRQYPLGKFSDRQTDTFYGSLHVMWQRILKRYPPGNGKRVFFIMYPKYEVLPFWLDYKKALYEVADYYSIPVCDLGKELGISSYADDQYIYWPETEYKGKKGLHDPHPSQKGADLYATAVANYIQRHFSLR